LGPGINPNHVFPLLVTELIPIGLIGVIMAGLASAIMSTVSSTLNAASTVITMDILRPLLLKDAPEKKIVRTGRMSAALMMVVSIGAALYFCVKQGQVFLIIQNIYSYFAAPVAALFILGIFWKGATPTAAVVTFISGFSLNEIVDRIIFQIAPFSNYDSFYNRATVVFFLSIIIMILVSLFTKKSKPDVVNAICWRLSDLRLRDDSGSAHRTKGLAVFWFFMVASIISVYIALFILQWTHS
jgi:SSS family solute:Na+ symporter